MTIAKCVKKIEEEQSELYTYGHSLIQATMA